MSSETQDTRQTETRHSFLRMAIVQLVTYIVLVAASVVAVGVDFGTHMVAVLGCVIIVAFLMFWPLRGTLIDRVMSLIAGVLALLLAVTPLGDMTFYPRLSPKTIHAGGTVVDIFPYARWASAFVILLVAITIVGFARQMARADRSHLVRSLSHSLVSAVACASVAGWTFLPRAFDHVHFSLQTLTVVVIVVAVFFASVLAVDSWLWWKDSDPDPQIRAPWIGFALLPVMLSGLVAYGCGLALTIIL